jgi:hypothetical protein
MVAWANARHLGMGEGTVPLISLTCRGLRRSASPEGSHGLLQGLLRGTVNERPEGDGDALAAIPVSAFHETRGP